MRATLVEEWTRQVDQMRMDLVVHADGTFSGRTSTPIRGEVDERSVAGTWSGDGGVFTFEVEGDEPLVVRVRDGALFFSPDRAEDGAEMRLVRN